MSIDPTRIVNRIHVSAGPKVINETTGAIERLHQAWILGVVPADKPMIPHLKIALDRLQEMHQKEYVERFGFSAATMELAAQTFDRNLARIRLKRNLHYFLAEDRNGEILMRPEPFIWPTSCAAEGIFLNRKFPVGMEDILAPESPDDHQAAFRAQPIKSTEPDAVAKWWFYINIAGIDRTKRVKMQTPEKVPLPQKD